MTDFPTIEDIKRDYNKLMDIIKDVRTVEQAMELEDKYNFVIEINGVRIDEYISDMESFYGESINRYEIDNMIEWIRYERFGCLEYIYDRFDGKPMFDVWNDIYADCGFIMDITIDKLTTELYEKSKKEYLR